MFRRSFTVLAAALALSFLPFIHAQSTSPSGAKTTMPDKVKPTALKPFDLNTASEDDLVLAGIERATAKKVIAARPFKNKNELVSQKLLTKEQYDKVKDLLVAKQPPKAPQK